MDKVVVLVLIVAATLTCALPEYKIAQGSVASEGEFPMAVQLHITKRTGNGICGASILTSNLLITAAHCGRGLSNLHSNPDNEIKVVAGQVGWTGALTSLNSLLANPRQRREGAHAQTSKVIDVVVHEDYKFNSSGNDVAILVLDKALEFDQYVKPVILPKHGQEFNGTGTICGWGTLTKDDVESHELRKAAVPLLKGEECVSSFSSFGDGDGGAQYEDQTMICAGGNGSDTCKGDSGGPLLCTSGSTQYLCGIASWGPGCGDLGIPTAYTRVSMYTNWIQQKIQEYETRNCSGQFQCGNGRCVPSSEVCNGANDCGNGQDELNCNSCSSEEFKCATKVGKCIPAKFVCDGDDDCGDGSDEAGCGRCNSTEFECGGSFCVSTICPTRAHLGGICYEAQCLTEIGLRLFGQCNESAVTCTKTVDGVCVFGYQECETLFTGSNSTSTSAESGQAEFGSSSNCTLPDQFDCRNGHCIQTSSKCNGINDCRNGYDETGCGTCPSDRFQCATLTGARCIQRHWVCDGDKDCADGSDERGCRGVVEPCNWAQFQCASGACVNSDRKCNGVLDCSDGSDERNCTSHQCAWNEFHCQSGACIDGTKKCNNQVDCLDRSDEIKETCWSTLCPQNSFKCATGQCVKNSDICDVWKDCVDQSDEHPAMCSKYFATIANARDILQVTAGADAELMCQTTFVTSHAHGAVPLMQWRLEDIVLNNTRLVHETDTLFQLILTIRNASTRDSGRYKCHVGRNSTSVLVAVSVPCHTAAATTTPTTTPAPSPTQIPPAPNSGWPVTNQIIVIFLLILNVVLLLIGLVGAWKFCNKRAQLRQSTLAPFGHTNGNYAVHNGTEMGTLSP